MNILDSVYGIQPPLLVVNPPSVNNPPYGVIRPPSPVYNFTGKTVPESIHQKTLELINYARKVAEPCLKTHQKQSHSVGSTAPIHLSYESVNMFNRQTHIHHHHGPRNDSKKKDNSSQRILVGIIGAITLAVTAFFLGKAKAQHEEGKEDAVNYKELKKDWNIHKHSYDSNYQLAVDNIVNPTDRLVRRKERERIHGLALLVLGLIAGAFALTGALLGSGALMLGGVVVGGVTGIIALYKRGYKFFNTRDQKDAKLVNRSITDLVWLPQPIIHSTPQW